MDEGNGHGWPHHGEIDIMEAINGDPKIHMATHSTNHHSGYPQHPPTNPYYVNADFTQGTEILMFDLMFNYNLWFHIFEVRSFDTNPIASDA